jgi:hypothetical protein
MRPRLVAKSFMFRFSLVCCGERSVQTVCQQSPVFLMNVIKNACPHSYTIGIAEYQHVRDSRIELFHNKCNLSFFNSEIQNPKFNASFDFCALTFGFPACPAYGISSISASLLRSSLTLSEICNRLLTQVSLRAFAPGSLAYPVLRLTK